MTAPGRQGFIQVPAILGLGHTKIVADFMPKGAIERSIECQVIGIFSFDRSLEGFLPVFKQTRVVLKSVFALVLLKRSKTHSLLNHKLPGQLYMSLVILPDHRKNKLVPGWVHNRAGNGKKMMLKSLLIKQSEITGLKCSE